MATIKCLKCGLLVVMSEEDANAPLWSEEGRHRRLCATCYKEAARQQSKQHGEFVCVFSVDHPGETAAGIRGFNDTVTVQVASGDPGGEPGEFAEFLQEALAEWYDGGRVKAMYQGIVLS